LSKEDAICLLELINSSLTCAREEDFRDLMERLGSVIPYDSATCVFARLAPGGVIERFEAADMNYPGGWVELCVERKFREADPAMKENFTRFSLQYWSDTCPRHDPFGDSLRYAEDFGRIGGHTSGSRSLRHAEGSLFSFAGNTLEHNSRTEAVIEFVVPHLHQVIARIAERQRPNRDIPLTPREKEVLGWIGRGKSTWDIAVILGISERTVKFHVRNIMQKLDVVSRAQAVAVALENGLSIPSSPLPSDKDL
jgi:DNA-binding CsgD family transcriptional regulator